ncbi:hypothetical protein AVEN_181403-1 [Araneus ventricosus]|uniref:Uncharacterized protein n=1 Tax=Araneus ventricosus TaxID=182803 RepID=A0A4Y2LE02_ARAVE|nr:hypothetical protein AVEN_181403-1 [Araneus ventricosus]
MCNHIISFFLKFVELKISFADGRNAYQQLLCQSPNQRLKGINELLNVPLGRGEVYFSLNIVKGLVIYFNIGNLFRSDFRYCFRVYGFLIPSFFPFLLYTLHFGEQNYLPDRVAEEDLELQVPR